MTTHPHPAGRRPDVKSPTRIAGAKPEKEMLSLERNNVPQELPLQAFPLANLWTLYFPQTKHTDGNFALLLRKSKSANRNRNPLRKEAELNGIS